MQEAIREYINLEELKNTPLDKIEDEIDKAEKYEIRKAREKQYQKWRNKKWVKQTIQVKHT